MTQRLTASAWRRPPLPAVVALVALMIIGIAVGGSATDPQSDQATQQKTEDTVKQAKKEELKQRLTSLQYRVTQEEGTEPPFANEFWDNKQEGIYVDVVDGTPLFSSLDKYDSGTGWPSFTKPLNQQNVVEKEDRALLMPRTEVRSKSADSHLGHVFDDGPGPTGKRFCMNSAALRFIPKANLEKEGYGEYLSLFEKKK